MPDDPKDVASKILRRCPRLVAHLIAESLGYATPMGAAIIIADAHRGRPNFCEWIAACFRGDPRPAVRRAIEYRRTHTGFMASYQQARAIVEQVRRGGEGPLLASWF